MTIDGRELIEKLQEENRKLRETEGELTHVILTMQGERMRMEEAIRCVFDAALVGVKDVTPEKVKELAEEVLRESQSTLQLLYTIGAIRGIVCRGGGTGTDAELIEEVKSIRSRLVEQCEINSKLMLKLNRKMEPEEAKAEPAKSEHVLRLEAGITKIAGKADVYVDGSSADAIELASEAVRRINDRLEKERHRRLVAEQDADLFLSALECLARVFGVPFKGDGSELIRAAARCKRLLAEATEE